MSSPQTGKFRRKAGRREKPLPDDGQPRTILAARLRELKRACGNPSYEKLAEFSGVYKTGLIEAASARRLPPLYVIDGYVKGCWAYYEDKFDSSFADADDLSRWHQLYRDAGGAPSGGGPRGTIGERDEQPEPQPPPPGATSEVPLAEGVAAAEDATERPPGLTRRHRAQPSGGRGAHIHVVVSIAVTLLIVTAGALIYRHLKTGATPPAAGGTAVQGNRGGSISVAAPRPACGQGTPDGFRSPATTSFANVKTLRTVSLEDLSASVQQGTYHGTTYVWLESNPTGNRAGIQLRWSNAPKKWYYCTATVEPGDVSALPGEFATIAIPATVSGHHVMYQACIWHQHPYTSQCSVLF
jgi:hypothetical protein